MNGADLWLWVVDADARGLTLAPAGRYAPRTRVEGVAVLHVLDLEGIRPEDAVGRRAWIAGGGDVRLLPPMLEGPRPTILAESAAQSAHGVRPLEGSSGARLARLVGLTLDQLLATWDCRNVLAADGGVLMPDAGLRDVVVLGLAAARALAAAHGCGVDDLYGKRVGGGRVREVLPHPSGKCFDWNDPGAARRARRALADQLRAVRGHAGVPAGAFEALAATRHGDQPEPDLRAVAGLLADAGVVAHPVEPGAAWRRVRSPAGGERAERTFADASVSLQGPPWTCDAWGRPIGGRATTRAEAVRAVELRALELGLREVAASWPRNPGRARACWCGAAGGQPCDASAVPPGGDRRTDVAVLLDGHEGDPVHVGRGESTPGARQIGGFDV